MVSHLEVSSTNLKFRTTLHDIRKCYLKVDDVLSNVEMIGESKVDGTHRVQAVP